ncbi:SCAN domain-containing protein 3 [Trichonephila clavipes]|nr:SCAN domain-containing protein 3 [Trichonephila clavipes]
MNKRQKTVNEMFEKVSVLLDSPTVSSEEFVAVNDDNVYTTPIMADKNILEFVQSSKNIIDVYFEDENEMNNAVLTPTSSEMRNIIKVSDYVRNRDFAKAHKWIIFMTFSVP